MKTSHFTITLLILNLQLLNGCAPVAVTSVMGGTTAVVTSVAEERGVGGVISDAGLRLKIKNHMDEYDSQLTESLEIIVRGGRVLLSGTVENQKKQIDAVRLTWEIKNVTEVFDEIQVGKEKTFSQNVQDSWISTRIKTRMVFSDHILSINYKIHTHNGIVYLMGIAQTQQELDEVISIARNVNGVKQVISNVTIKNGTDNSTVSSSPQVSTVNTEMSPQPWQQPETNPYSPPPASINDPNNSSAFQ